MATSFFHEETIVGDQGGNATLVRYYFDDISSEVLTRSFRLFADPDRTEFIDNERIPFADLRADLKAQLLEFLARKKRIDLRQAS
jgi:hypothetical protein